MYMCTDKVTKLKDLTAKITQKIYQIFNKKIKKYTYRKYYTFFKNRKMMAIFYIKENFEYIFLKDLKLNLCKN